MDGRIWFGQRIPMGMPMEMITIQLGKEGLERVAKYFDIKRRHTTLKLTRLDSRREELAACTWQLCHY